MRPDHLDASHEVVKTADDRVVSHALVTAHDALACRFVLLVEARGACIKVAHVAAIPMLTAVAAQVAAVANSLLN